MRQSASARSVVFLAILSSPSSSRSTGSTRTASPRSGPRAAWREEAETQYVTDVARGYELFHRQLRALSRRERPGWHRPAAQRPGQALQRADRRRPAGHGAPQPELHHERPDGRRPLRLRRPRQPHGRRGASPTARSTTARSMSSSPGSRRARTSSSSTTRPSMARPPPEPGEPGRRGRLARSGLAASARRHAAAGLLAQPERRHRRLGAGRRRRRPPSRGVTPSPIDRRHGRRAARHQARGDRGPALQGRGRQRRSRRSRSSAGETIQFEVDNTAGFDHNFCIGTPEELAVPNAHDGRGHPDLAVGCPDGHLDRRAAMACSSPARCPATTTTMHGDIVVAGLGRAEGTWQSEHFRRAPSAGAPPSACSTPMAGRGPASRPRFWFLFIIFMLGYIPNLAYYFTVSNTVSVGYNFAVDRQLVPGRQRGPALSGAGRRDAALADEPAGAGAAGRRARAPRSSSPARTSTSSAAAVDGEASAEVLVTEATTDAEGTLTGNLTPWTRGAGAARAARRRRARHLRGRPLRDGRARRLRQPHGHDLQGRRRGRPADRLGARRWQRTGPTR